MTEPSSQKVVVTGPLGGLFDLDAADLTKAQKDGYRLATDAEIKTDAEEKQYGGLGGMAAAGLAGAARGATIGLSDVALTQSGLVAPEKLYKLTEYNPLASGIGEATGVIAPMFFTGGTSGALGVAARATPVGVVSRAAMGAERLGVRALGEGLAARTAVRGVTASVEGAIYGIGERAAELSRAGVTLEQIADNPELLAESMMAGMGYGGAMAVGGTLIGAGLGRLVGAGKRAGEQIVAPVTDRLTGRQLEAIPTPSMGITTSAGGQMVKPTISGRRQRVSVESPASELLEPPKRTLTVAEQHIKEAEKEGLIATAERYLDERRAVKDLASVQTETRNTLIKDLDRLEVIRDDVLENMTIERKLNVIKDAIKKEPPPVNPIDTFSKADEIVTSLKNQVDEIIKDGGKTFDGGDVRRAKNLLGKSLDGIVERIQEPLKRVGGPTIDDLPNLYKELDHLKRRTQRTAKDMTRQLMGRVDEHAEALRQNLLDPQLWGQRVVDIQAPDNKAWERALSTRSAYWHDILARERGSRSVNKYHTLSAPDPNKIRSAVDTASDVMPNGEAVQFGTRSIVEHVPNEVDLAIQLIRSHQGGPQYQRYIKELEDIKNRTAANMAKARITADMASKAKDTEETLRSLPLGGLIHRGFESISGAQRAMIKAMPTEDLIKYEFEKTRANQKQIANLLSDSGPIGRQLVESGATQQEILSAISAGGPITAELQRLGTTQQETLKNLLESQTKALQDFDSIRATQRAIRWGKTKDNVITSIKDSVNKFWSKTVKAGEVVTEKGRRLIAPAAAQMIESEPLSMRFQQKVQELENNDTDVKVANNAVAQLGETAPFAPNVTNAYIDLAKRKAQFLQSKRPISLTRSSDVFAHLDDRPRVSDSEMARYLRYADAVDNPVGAVRDFEKGNLSREAAEALRVVYPQIHATIEKQVTEKLASAKEPLPYKSLIHLSVLLNRPLHPAMEPRFIQATQSVYTEMAESSNNASPPSRSVPNFAKNEFSQSQRLG